MPKKITTEDGDTYNLNDQQIAFADLIHAGLRPFDAYRRVYKTGARKTPNVTPYWTNAYTALARPAVQAYLALLQAETAAQARADRAEKLRILEDQLRDPDLSPKERREALKLHNEMTGDNAPVRHEVSHSLDLHTLTRNATP